VWTELFPAASGRLAEEENDFSEMKELQNRYTGGTQAVGIHLSPEVVDYFKGMLLRSCS
jgi:hypothetical protein